MRDWRCCPDRVIVSCLCTAALATGCTREFVMDAGESADALSQRASQFQVGATSRESIRAALGEPVWTYDDPRLDVYRLSDQQWKLHASMGGGWLPPVAYPTWENLYAYLMFVYDADELLRGRDVEQGARKDWIVLEADDVVWVVVGDALDAQIALGGARLHARLAELRADAHCTVVISASPSWDWVRIAIDGQPLTSEDEESSWTGAAALLPEWLVPVRLAPGTHRFEAREPATDGTDAITLECQPGMVTFLDAEPRLRTAQMTSRDAPIEHRTEFHGFVFSVSGELPPDSSGRPMLMWARLGGRLTTPTRRPH